MADEHTPRSGRDAPKMTTGTMEIGMAVSRMMAVMVMMKGVVVVVGQEAGVPAFDPPL